MAKARSPRYPAIGLDEAIERVRKVYEQDYQNRIPKQLVAEHMGYGSLNGKSLGVLSALSKYGLLEGRADEMCVSDRALNILANEFGAPDRAKAIQAAASEPELFVELDAQFPGKASDAAIRSYLLTKRKFLPEAADKLIRSYRDTRDLVERECGQYDSPSEAEIGEEEVAVQPTVTESQTAPNPPPAASPARPSGTPYTIQLSGDRVQGSFDVDAQGLRKLLKILKAQEALLNMEDDSDEGAEAGDNEPLN
ncbi:MAG: hypothetical protein NXI21_02510 [Alphaproteobacteria bacterium]|nr:hypothetical protein [Alphaproteobacteria bacterium]